MIALIPWFRSAPLPDIVSDPSIIVGGTDLLAEFLRVSSGARTPCTLSIAAPFVSLQTARTLSMWRGLPHETIAFQLVTGSSRDARAAKQELLLFPWASSVVVVRRHLHAKLYVLRDASGRGACLVGSHNLTAAGATTNAEAGVLFLGNHGPELTEIIDACHNHVLRLSRQGSVFSDSRRWLPSEAA